MSSTLSAGEAIRVARLRKGMTQEQLARELRVHRVTINNWELGKTRPSPINLSEIARHLDIDPATFVPDISRHHAANFGAMIRKVRIEEELSVAELGSWLGRTPRTIESWERGERVPNAENIQILERILGRKLEIDAARPAPLKLDLISAQCTDAWRDLTPAQQTIFKAKMDAACDVVNELTRGMLGVVLHARV